MSSKNQEIEQNVVGDFLEHYGVKGMKWGKKKNPLETTVTEYNNIDLSHLSEKERAKFLADLKILASKKDADKEIQDLLDSVSTSKKKEKTYITVGKKAYTKKEWDKKVIEDAKKTKLANDNHWTTKLNKLGRKFGLDSDIFTTETTYSSIQKTKVLKPEAIKHEDIVGEFLEHHGVLGMKWGVRKDNRSGRRPGTNRDADKPAKHATFATTDKSTGNPIQIDYNPRKVQIRRTAQGIEITGKSRKLVREASDQLRSQMEKNAKERKSVTAKVAMSDDELRSAINRLQMEKTFSQLTAKPAKESSALSKFMTSAGSQILSQAVVNVGGEYLKQALKVNIDKNVKPEYRILKAKKPGKD